MITDDKKIKNNLNIVLDTDFLHRVEVISKSQPSIEYGKFLRYSPNSFKPEVIYRNNQSNQELLFLGTYSAFGADLNDKTIKRYYIGKYQLKTLTKKGEVETIDFYGQREIATDLYKARKESLKLPDNGVERDYFNASLNEYISVLKAAIVNSVKKEKQYIGNIEKPDYDNGIWFIYEEPEIEFGIEYAKKIKNNKGESIDR